MRDFQERLAEAREALRKGEEYLVAYVLQEDVEDVKRVLGKAESDASITS